MRRSEKEDLVRALNGLKHELLAHKVFQKCFKEAVDSGQIRGLEKTSLFRSTLAYFLLVPNAHKRFLTELQRTRSNYPTAPLSKATLDPYNLIVIHSCYHFSKVSCDENFV
jgi:hypothetical protein